MKKRNECSKKIAGLKELAERYGVKVKESSKLSAAIKRLTKLGVKVTDTTCKGKAIGFVGGVRRPEPKSVDDDNPAGGPKPSVN